MRNQLLLTLMLALCGCAVGNTYDYRNALVGIPLTGTAEVSVEVLDERPYVISGDKPATFVGLQRGGFGNPFNVNTTSGEALADDLTTTIKSAMTKRGYTIVDTQNTPERKLQLQLVEWKSDVMMRMRILYHLVLRVFDGNEQLLATSVVVGEEVLGGGFQSANTANAASTFEVKFSELLRHEEVQRALFAD